MRARVCMRVRVWVCVCVGGGGARGLRAYPGRHTTEDTHAEQAWRAGRQIYDKFVVVGTSCATPVCLDIRV